MPGGLDGEESVRDLKRRWAVRDCRGRKAPKSPLWLTKGGSGARPQDTSSIAHTTGERNPQGDPASGTRELQPARDGRVRCSALFVRRHITKSSTKASPLAASPAAASQD